MFGVTAKETGEESEKLLQEFVSIQEEIVSELGLHFRFKSLVIHVNAHTAHMLLLIQSKLLSTYVHILKGSPNPCFSSEVLYILTISAG